MAPDESFPERTPSLTQNYKGQPRGDARGNVRRSPQ